MSIITIKTPVITAEMVRAEAGRRIGAVLKDEATQRNMTALASHFIRKEAANAITDAEKATLDLLDAAQGWVQSTLSTGRTLAATTGYDDDSKWPAPPAGLADLVAQL